MTIKERLIEFCESRNISKSEFERKCGLSNGYINSIRKGIGDERLEKILEQFPELNRNWLLFEEGEMLGSHAIIQEALGDNNTSIAGNSNNVNNSSTLERAIDEISEMRKLIQQQVNNNQEQFDRFMSVIERLTSNS